jgi:hypothetical protein
MIEEHGWPRTIQALEIHTWQTTSWAPMNLLDKPDVFAIALSGDGQTITYSYDVQTSDLYVIEPPK